MSPPRVPGTVPLACCRTVPSTPGGVVSSLRDCNGRVRGVYCLRIVTSSRSLGFCFSGQAMGGGRRRGGGPDLVLRDPPIERQWTFLEVLWLERGVALEECDGRLTRRGPKEVGDIVERLGEDSGAARNACRQAFERTLQWVSAVN